ncbi:hypothetical protein [Acidiphilium acidophilum]|uniref:Uncharacterized protein n=1 Tax=Acidiphilium acidophilum TaxID=76588 RepID=A0AAW9DN84_ACIAO|nr:hypothetical protein [Acidiphilium acidophilum]MDX5929502.1 hypothetical protein [Acidiphilium acidophilum]MEE3504485.1 hypothetical protein [Acidiphilium acidophilum]GBQ16998.1 hypothetical protein AA700_1239 [Acidiphilium acidophilum DSM 700]
MNLKLTLAIGVLMAASAGLGGFVVYQRIDTRIAVLRSPPAGQRDYTRGLDQGIAAECANLKRLTGHEPADCHISAGSSADPSRTGG